MIATNAQMKIGTIGKIDIIIPIVTAAVGYL